MGRRILISLIRGEPLITLAADIVRVFEREGARLLFVGCRFADLAPQEFETVKALVQGIMRLELQSRSGLVGQGENREVLPGEGISSKAEG